MPDVSDFIPGQRWVSDAEPELGLGTVLRCDARAVQVLYAKAGVVRNYAAHGAPLSRAAFRVGQQITGRDLNRQPTLMVRAGWPLRVLVSKDMILAPYP